MSKQMIKDGTIVKFAGYAAGADGSVPKGELNVGDSLTVVGYDAEQETYNVVKTDDEKVTDSLFTEEFEVATPETEVAPATKKRTAPAKTAPTKTAAKTKAAPVETPAAEEQEEEAEEEEQEEEEQEEAPAETEAAPARTRTAPTKKATSRTAKVETPAKAEEEPIVLLPFKRTASFTNALEDHEGDVLATARDLADAKEKMVYTLGGVLAYAKRNNTHLELTEMVEGVETCIYTDDLNGFNSWMKDEVGLEPRSGNYYIDIYETFSQVTTEAKIAKIGWTKLREILPARRILTKDNADEIISFAKENSTKAVQDYIKEKLVASGVELHGRQTTAKMVTFKFSAHDDQAEVIKEAIDVCRAKLGEKATDAQVWNQIATDYLAFNSAEQK